MFELLVLVGRAPTLACRGHKVKILGKLAKL
jgi:hypothetical protein